jgi:DNA-binding NarL/FixJ family response regulator
MMDDFTNLAEYPEGPRRSPVLVIIERHMLTRTCILSILKRELSGFEIIEMATMSDLNRASGRDIRLVALNMGDKSITDPAIEDDLAVLAESFPHVPVALLSSRDDEATASSAMRRGVRGFFSHLDSGRGRHRRAASCSRRRRLPTVTD